MNHADRKARIRKYKETPRPAGVYRVRNTVTGKLLIGSTSDLPAMLNRQRFQLEMGADPAGDLCVLSRMIRCSTCSHGVLRCRTCGLRSSSFPAPGRRRHGKAQGCGDLQQGNRGNEHAYGPQPEEREQG